MVRIIPTTATRIGIVTFAAFGALVGPASIAGAAPSAITAPTTTHVVSAAPNCDALEATLAQAEVQLLDLEDRLAAAPPAEKPAILAQIERVERRITTLEGALRHCL